MLQYFSTLDRETSILVSASLPVDSSKFCTVEQYTIMELLRDFVAVFLSCCCNFCSLYRLALNLFYVSCSEKGENLPTAKRVICTDDLSVDF